jgi:hypothetical protein
MAGPRSFFVRERPLLARDDGRRRSLVDQFLPARHGAGIGIERIVRLTLDFGLDRRWAEACL